MAFQKYIIVSSVQKISNYTFTDAKLGFATNKHFSNILYRVIREVFEGLVYYEKNALKS